MISRGQSITFGLLLTLAFAAGWVAQGWRADAASARVESTQASQGEAQAKQSQAVTEKKAEAVVEHGTAQQENTHDYTQEMARLEAGRTADAARIAGLQHDIRSAATRNAQLASDAAARRDLADQHQRLAALAAEGAEVVGELSGLVEKRDAQVKLLRGQIAADRALLEQIN
ncbi:hypothetical protein [Comamonas testosteroni]|uniref:Uncharacterized protein n=1 Tax=Comamonas testosteroni TaxID=285 RepID=A0A096GRD0_COMTE|nr:hypothetical protein [Comamonas testosteroni]KGH27770.1 hypothetical protein P353_17285 [Comamonas testosteroni]